MAFTAHVLKVMIASPGDVPRERQIAQQVIHAWNALHSEDRHQVLLPVAWETHVAPAIGDRAQAIINRQLLDGADLLVAIFWTRLGTPTGEAPSGTVEETPATGLLAKGPDAAIRHETHGAVASECGLGRRWVFLGALEDSTVGS